LSKIWQKFGFENFDLQIATNFEERKSFSVILAISLFLVDGNIDSRKYTQILDLDLMSLVFTRDVFNNSIAKAKGVHGQGQGQRSRTPRPQVSRPSSRQ